MLAVDTDLTLNASSVTGSAGPGVLMSQVAGTVADNVIDNNMGGGVRVEAGLGEIRVERNQLHGNAGFGLGMFSAKGIIIIENHVASTALGAKVCRAAPGDSEAQHQHLHAAEFQHQRSFNEERATRPRIAEMIQNRTTIFCSGQSSFSKW